MASSKTKSWWEYSRWVWNIARNSRISNQEPSDAMNEVRRFVEYFYDFITQEGARPWLADNFYKKSIGKGKLPIANLAKGTVTVVDNSALIGGETVTADADTVTEGVDWVIGADGAETAKNIADAINAVSTTVIANNSGMSVVISALVTGEAGNALALASSDAVNLLTSGANLEGADDDADYEPIHAVIEMLGLIGRDLKKIPLTDMEAMWADTLIDANFNRRLGTKGDDDGSLVDDFYGCVIGNTFGSND